MTNAEFKKIARLLKEAYAELEAAALKKGISPFSKEFKIMQDNARNFILQSYGFSLNEYRKAKEESEAARIKAQEEANKMAEYANASVNTILEKVSMVKGDKGDPGTSVVFEDVVKAILPLIPKPVDGKTPTPEELKALILPLIPKVENGKTPTTEELIALITPLLPNIDEYLGPLRATLGYLDDKVTNLKIPPAVDTEQLKREILTQFQDNFGSNFKKNIDTLGMPDFRKLAMGLQGQIDDILRRGTGGGHTIEDEGTPLTQRTKLNFVGAGVTVTDDSGDDATVVTISGASVDFVDNEVASGSGTSFAIANTPVAGSVKVYALGQRLVLTTDYSISGTTITTVNSWGSGDIICDYRK